MQHVDTIIPIETRAFKDSNLSLTIMDTITGFLGRALCPNKGDDEQAISNIVFRPVDTQPTLSSIVCIINDNMTTIHNAKVRQTSTIGHVK